MPLRFTILPLTRALLKAMGHNVDEEPGGQAAAQVPGKTIARGPKAQKDREAARRRARKVALGESGTVKDDRAFSTLSCEAITERLRLAGIPVTAKKLSGWQVSDYPSGVVLDYHDVEQKGDAAEAIDTALRFLNRKGYAVRKLRRNGKVALAITGPQQRG